MRMMMMLSGHLLFTFFVIANAEWIAITTELPSGDISESVAVNLSLAWDEESGSGKTISLTLTRNKAFPKSIPIYSLDERDGQVKQINGGDLQNTVFYQDVEKQGAISLTKQTNGQLDIRGSFVAGNSMYNIEPYHPKLHKRNAEMGDHLILKRDTSSTKTTDFVLPEPGSEDWEILEQSRKLYNSTKASSVRTLSLPVTTNQVQLYIVVDSYLYAKLSSVSQLVQWSAGADNFVAYYMGHLANEVDIRYRGIPSDTISISTMLSYLYVAKTSTANPYSAGSVNTAALQADAGTLLNSLRDWVTNNRATLPTDADHYMLQTSLDLTYSGSASNAGLASVGGACLSSPVSVNEYLSSNTAAHELGHNLGASHDGDGNTCSGNDLYVMAAVGSSTSGSTIGNPWKFSPCSINYMRSFIQTLNSQGKNCLLNKGAYISSWETDSTKKLGQAISADRQCQIIFGDGYAFVGGTQYINDTCNQLWCIQLATGSLRSNGGAMQYTTCGNQAWCDKEKCVYDSSAPSVDPSCPFGDRRGRLYSNSDLTCATVTGADCYSSAAQSGCCAACKNFRTGVAGCEYGDKASWCATQTYPTTCNYNAATCCGSCASHATPWLGSACPYGDKASWCATLPLTDCPLNSQTCCQRCCKTNCTRPPASTTAAPASTPSTVTTTTSATTTKVTASTPSTVTTTTSATTTKVTAPPSSSTAAPITSTLTTKAAVISTTTLAITTRTNPPTTTQPTTTVSADQQCVSIYGSGYAFVGGALYTNDTCSTLWCVNLATGSLSSQGGAKQYTSCGNQMWCENGKCVYNANAPIADPTCPFGDSKGRLFSNSNKTCETITAPDCYTSSVKSSCCATCKKYYKGVTGCEYGDKSTQCTGLSYPYTCNTNAATCCGSCQPYATPWLGAACPYGDKSSGCATLALSSCSLNLQTCCQRCCTVNCTQPTTPSQTAAPTTTRPITTPTTTRLITTPTTTRLITTPATTRTTVLPTTTRIITTPTTTRTTTRPPTITTRATTRPPTTTTKPTTRTSTTTRPTTRTTTRSLVGK